jgi:DNA-binding response OmpR family regulator
MKVLRDSNRFLLVEDNKGDVELIKEYLSESEADVTIDHAETFKDAKKLLNGEPSFDCVLLDINLPDAKGVTLIEDIISLARGIPVIVLTGHDGETFGANAISMGYPTIW